jgi:CCR4-NOT transcription complex subunit 1
VLLARTQLCRLADLDAHLAAKTSGGASLPWVDVAMQFAKQCVLERVAGWADLGAIFDALGQAAQRHAAPVARKVAKFMEELRHAAAQLQAAHGPARLASLPPLVPGRGGGGGAAGGGGSDLQSGGGGGGAGGAAKRAAGGLDSAREQVTYLLERWLRVWNESGGAEAKCVPFLALLHQQHVLASDETTDVFVRLATELCVDACLKTAHPPPAGAAAAPSGEGSAAGDGPAGSSEPGLGSSGNPPGQSQLVYTVVDAYSSLLVVLVKHAAADPPSVASRVAMLNKVLAAVARALLADCHASAAADPAASGKRAAFDQRPYFRVFMNLLRALNATHDPVVEQNNVQVLGAFAHAWHGVQPLAAPGFAFAWLELVSHRTFLPQLLLAKPHQKGWALMHRLLVALFAFLEPFLRRAQLPPPVRTLYKGTLRVLLVLLHDFPEFLADYHFSFCDVVPPNCVQLRNLFLSAFPRAMRLPDPFTPNLKVDLLPEIAQPPRLLSNVVASLAAHNLRADLDAYLKTANANADSAGAAGGGPAAAAARLHAAAATAAFLERLPSRLRAAPAEVAAPGHAPVNAPGGGGAYNVPAINALVVYAGAQGLVHLQTKQLTHSPVMDVFARLLAAFDAEGRYALLNAVANQLRYPNTHTHYFSCVLLFLFAEATSDLVKEQVTRVLLERLIVHRPHPWGLLITFIELIKNPRYNFWAHQFTHCAPEIEKVFESVARSCMGPQGVAAGAHAADGDDAQGSSA